MRLKISRKAIFLSLFVAVLFVLVGHGAINLEKSTSAIATQDAKPNIIYTTADLKSDYDIIGVITHYQEFAKLSMKDPLLGALKKGMEGFEKKVIEAGANAVVGLRYQFTNPTKEEEGRLLIYGTAVKTK
jgi:hypothetical protein